MQRAGAAAAAPARDPAVYWLWGLIAAAWALAVALALGGQTRLLAHESLLDGPRSWPAALLLFLLAWQLMTVGMMLPSSLPVLRVFRLVSRAQHHPGRGLAGFLLGYALVWTGFALAAFAGDTLVHAAVERWRWLEERPWLLTGGALLLAGAYQFSPLKDRCLSACRHPVTVVRRYYARGFGGGWRLGLRHGRDCLGCCWGLMLLMFGVGVGNLAWMAALTGVMVAEKTLPFGRRLVPVIGLTLIGLGLTVLTHGILP